MKKLFVALTIFSCCLVSCRKVQDFTYDHRTPHKVAFQERVLPAGFVIGSKRPSGVVAVDLGLSVKWANMNIGATAETEIGETFAWGEIAPKESYSWRTYEFNNYHEGDATLYLTKYCFDFYGESQDVKAGDPLNKFDDVAYLNWGEGYRIPTAEEFSELEKKCQWTYDTKTRTYTVTGSNGNSIKIKWCQANVGDNSGENTLIPGLWARELVDYASCDAKMLRLTHADKNKVDKGLSSQNRFVGLQIRPVYVD